MQLRYINFVVNVYPNMIKNSPEQNLANFLEELHASAAPKRDDLAATTVSLQGSSREKLRDSALLPLPVEPILSPSEEASSIAHKKLFDYISERANELATGLEVQQSIENHKREYPKFFVDSMVFRAILQKRKIKLLKIESIDGWIVEISTEPERVLGKYYVSFRPADDKKAEGAWGKP